MQYKIFFFSRLSVKVGDITHRNAAPHNMLLGMLFLLLPARERCACTNVVLSCYRSDEEEGSGSKYGRMESAEDSMQDKERFAR